MENSKQKQTWNRRKSERSEDTEEPLSEKHYEDEERELDMVASAQRRWGVSREEARRIIRDSDEF